MENIGWVKLHRKVRDSEIIKDQAAWQLFSWLLVSIDRKIGTYTTGRFLLAEQLDCNSNTIYKTLKRLEKKYKVVTLSSNNKFTTITLVNWDKYQSTEETVTQDGNNKGTTKKQQSNTKQEVENIRSKEEEHILAAKISNKLIISRSQEMTFLKEFPGMTTTELREQVQKCNSYMNMSSNGYTNPGLFFRGWLNRYVKEKTVKNNEYNAARQAQENLPALTKEETQRNLERLAAMKKKLRLGVMK